MLTHVHVPLTHDAVRAGIDACRVDALRDIARAKRSDDPRMLHARADAFEKVRTDLDRLGARDAIARAALAYAHVPVVPKHLQGRHPAARGRGEALERVLRAAGVDPSRIDAIRRVRPRFVDDPQAAS